MVQSCFLGCYCLLSEFEPSSGAVQSAVSLGCECRVCSIMHIIHSSCACSGWQSDITRPPELTRPSCVWMRVREADVQLQMTSAQAIASLFLCTSLGKLTFKNEVIQNFRPARAQSSTHLDLLTQLPLGVCKALFPLIFCLYKLCLVKNT